MSVLHPRSFALRRLPGAKKSATTFNLPPSALT